MHEQMVPRSFGLASLTGQVSERARVRVAPNMCLSFSEQQDVDHDVYRPSGPS